MSNKGKSIYFAIFAVLYLGYTAFIAGHGIHGTNAVITIAAIGLSGFYFLKDSKK